MLINKHSKTPMMMMKMKTPRDTSQLTRTETDNRPALGVASAPAIFQRTMESLFRGIPLVAVYLDDILASGGDEADHIKNLDNVLKRRKEAGLRLRRNKCTFLQEEVEYLGSRADTQG